MVDYFKSVSDERQAIVLVQELIAICATGGFKLTKWISNSCSVLTSIPEEERSKDVRHLDLRRVELPVDSALGLQWDTESDTFLFKITLKLQQFTRRGILYFVPIQSTTHLDSLLQKCCQLKGLDKSCAE